MKKLTLKQLQILQNLSEHPLINETKLQFQNNGITRITIESAVGADMLLVDLLIKTELGKSFSNLEYIGTPAQHTNPITGFNEEIHFISWEGEPFIWLVMVKEHEEVVWDLETIMRNKG